jgi:hypothetical protein
MLQLRDHATHVITSTRAARDKIRAILQRVLQHV